ncbi:MAG: zinc ribbon domain-containing protein [Candidatus Thermoplasmatota archaeon]|jgi:Na+-transporting methylmalonyl-CoA/oxaloacetate decarboxylase gamma subunit|nr:zinc ribbon domain-containing protein [Candidatus Thermoplasmatota archaeon]MCL5963347.1 zinc ribbon domain-containing protein [Candidatus Thermoplasmatota archaeon]
MDQKNKKIPRTRLIILGIMMIVSIIFLNMSMNNGWWVWQYSSSNTGINHINDVFMLKNENIITYYRNGTTTSSQMSYAAGTVSAVTVIEKAPDFVSLMYQTAQFVTYASYFSILSVMIFFIFVIIPIDPKYTALFAMIAMLLLAYAFIGFTLKAPSAPTADGIVIKNLRTPSGSIDGNSTGYSNNGTLINYQLLWYPGMGYIYAFISLLIDIAVFMSAVTTKFAKPSPSTAGGNAVDSKNRFNTEDNYAEDTENITTAPAVYQCPECSTIIDETANRCPQCNAYIRWGF